MIIMTNWETWNVSLWLNNDESLQNEALRICNKDDNPYEYESQRVDELRDFVIDLLDQKIITDHISIHRVNFQEIIADFQQTIKENQERLVLDSF